MNPELLQQLPDIHLPPAINWWPPAFGWWVLALLLLALTVFMAIKISARHASNVYRREAIIELASLKQQYHQQPLYYLQEMVALLRRLVKTACPDKQWESLPVLELFKTIEKTRNNIEINQIVKEVIEGNIYGKEPENTNEINGQIHSFISTWIRTHRRAK